MPQAFIYQILNHYTPRQALDPGFRVLDNSANERPDWYEYWPIRNFLLNEALDEGAFYGFLSPKFKLKTNLDAAHVEALVRDADSSIDVILLTPSIHNSAYYLNVFAHGDAKHPGLLDVAQQVLRRLGRNTDLAGLVTDSRTEVFSNYFVARPRFWREWLAITEAIFAIAEDPADALGARLRALAPYRSRATAPMKIFVVERIATWILNADPSFHGRVVDPFAAAAKIHRTPVAVICDALKIAYATQGRGQYLDVFYLVQAVRRTVTLHVRIGAWFGSRPVRQCLQRLSAYWGDHAGH
ncbi:MAG: hypothetical protein ACHQIL_02590 [Steroidobacterales bacterium]